ncbi:MAG: CDP-diacylglycerol--glycerol-3-phosphate 3-phosphatidyltransferase [Oscillospiraceae bacterium]|jgi:CDP-diacylglycerol--glycerol-3-phosphate 3-phosphatidyltransferase|nr:CDP-diacylglycerol--glycerol-3-phosphate 3-phosphatidyltransferase [Oscillospiraceae bacterium]
MTVPNILTMSRVAVIPFFVVSMAMDWRLAALVLFAAASLTDMLDGYLARKMGQVTKFGKFMDPLADKLLVFAAMVFFLSEGTMAAWVALLVLAREFIISSLRMVAAASGTVIAADWSGKVKTTVQIACVLIILTPWHDTALSSGIRLCDAASWLIAAVTLWSGLDYLIRYRKILRDEF